MSPKQHQVIQSSLEIKNPLLLAELHLFKSPVYKEKLLQSCTRPWLIVVVEECEPTNSTTKFIRIRLCSTSNPNATNRFQQQNRFMCVKFYRHFAINKSFCNIKPLTPMKALDVVKELPTFLQFIQGNDRTRFHDNPSNRC